MNEIQPRDRVQKDRRFVDNVLRHAASERDRLNQRRDHKRFAGGTLCDAEDHCRCGKWRKSEKTDSAYIKRTVIDAVGLPMHENAKMHFIIATRLTVLPWCRPYLSGLKLSEQRVEINGSV